MNEGCKGVSASHFRVSHKRGMIENFPMTVKGMEESGAEAGVADDRGALQGRVGAVAHGTLHDSCFRAKTLPRARLRTASGPGGGGVENNKF